MKLVRRTIVKGLLAAGFLPFAKVEKAVAAAPVSFSRAEISWYNGLDAQSVAIDLNDKNDKDGVLRAYIAEGLKWFDETSSVPNDDKFRFDTTKKHAELLTPLRLRRDIYKFAVMCDERNNWPNMMDNNSKHADAFIQPLRMAIGHINIRFIHDPSYLVS